MWYLNIMSSQQDNQHILYKCFCDYAEEIVRVFLRPNAIRKWQQTHVLAFKTNSACARYKQGWSCVGVPHMGRQWLLVRGGWKDEMRLKRWNHFRRIQNLVIYTHIYDRYNLVSVSMCQCVCVWVCACMQSNMYVFVTRMYDRVGDIEGHSPQICRGRGSGRIHQPREQTVTILCMHVCIRSW